MGRSNGASSDDALLPEVGAIDGGSGDSGPRTDLQSILRKIRLPLVPPKPNEFDSATLIGMRRATFGT